MSNAIEVTGHCAMCTYGDKPVFHGTPWCPDIPAVACVDWNAAREGADGQLRFRTSHTTRPVEIGEAVLLLCDGDMVAWGRAEQVGRMFQFILASETPNDGGNAYLTGGAV